MVRAEEGNRYQNDGQGKKEARMVREVPVKIRGDRGNSRYGGNRPQGRVRTTIGQSRFHSDAQWVEQQKSQRNKGKDKEKDYKKKEYRGTKPLTEKEKRQKSKTGSRSKEKTAAERGEDRRKIKQIVIRKC